MIGVSLEIFLTNNVGSTTAASTQCWIDLFRSKCWFAETPSNAKRLTLLWCIKDVCRVLSFQEGKKLLLDDIEVHIGNRFSFKSSRDAIALLESRCSKEWGSALPLWRLPQNFEFSNFKFGEEVGNFLGTLIRFPNEPIPWLVQADHQYVIAPSTLPRFFLLHLSRMTQRSIRRAPFGIHSASNTNRITTLVVHELLDNRH